MGKGDTGIVLRTHQKLLMALGCWSLGFLVQVQDLMFRITGLTAKAWVVGNHARLRAFWAPDSKSRLRCSSG